MPADPPPAGAPRPTRTSARTSSRYSLNLSSVGKAIADVMNKDSRDSGGDKASRKSKENSSRRLSAVGTTQSGAGRPRSSLASEKAPATSKDATSPRNTGPITRASRRSSTLSRGKVEAISEDGVMMKGTAALSPSDNGTAHRRSTLRPRNPATGSALPKYRPKSMLAEPITKPPSPTRPATRRRLSSSSDEVQNATSGKKTPQLQVPSPAEKTGRSISPLPNRVLKTNLTINVSPSTPTKLKAPSRKTPSPTRDTPKSSKVASPGRSAIPRPPSSSSSSSSLRTPQTPTPHRDSKSRMGSPSKNGSPLRNPAASRPEVESPLGKRMKKTTAPNGTKVSPAKKASPGIKISPTTPVSTSMADSSMDSLDDRDVDFLLGSVISPTAPTPAVPRFRQTLQQHAQFPETPSRQPGLPTRANMSYLSPMPPPSDQSPSKAKRVGNDRGSLLSWDQLVAAGEQSIGEGEADSMIIDIPAPFSGAASPATSTIELDIPDSPSLSALPSPAGYGSISQVLLPDVTPSPMKYGHLTPERISGDASMVTMLRLQLASMEHIAKERLGQIQALEQQLGATTNARVREADELARQVTYLEEQLRGSLEMRDRVTEEQAERIATLENQLGQTTALRDAAVQEAVQMAINGTMELKNSAVRVECQKWEAACAARSAASGWDSVRDLAEGELELVRSNREMLSTLLAGLDQSQRQLMCNA